MNLSWAIATGICVLIIYFLFIYILFLRRKINTLIIKDDAIHQKKVMWPGLLDVLIIKLIRLRKAKKLKKTSNQRNKQEIEDSSKIININILHKNNENINNVYISADKEAALISSSKQKNLLDNIEKVSDSTPSLLGDALKQTQQVSGDLFQRFNKILTSADQADELENDDEYASGIGSETEYQESEEDKRFREDHTEPLQEDLDNDEANKTSIF